MRVLWFTSSPSLAAEHLNMKLNGLGWISTLEKYISHSKEIELGISFPLEGKSKSSFSIDGTRYFPFQPAVLPAGFRGIIERWTNPMPESPLECWLSIIKEFNPDLIHVFGTEHGFGELASRADIPVVIHLQGNIHAVLKKWYVGISSCQVFRHSRMRALILGYGLWHYHRLFSSFAERERRVFKQCRYFIGRTQWDRRITTFFSPESRYFHCDEVIREEFFNKLWKKTVTRPIILFSTLGAHTYKGLESILEVSSMLKSRELDFVWKVAGVKGNEEVVRIIEKIYRQKFADFQVNFLGSLPAGILAEELCNSHIYIHPSHIENSPNSVCEAMLIGVPVIATYAGGIPSIVSDQEEGILVQDGDPYAIAGAIIELIVDQKLAADLGAKAREKAFSRHQAEKIVGQLLSIYSQILSENTRT